MSFPIQLTSKISVVAGTTLNRTVVLHNGLTLLLGPNGAGKTQLLRGLRDGLIQVVANKKVRFISSGRMGPLEQFRSDYDGNRGYEPQYANARYGSKGDIVRRHIAESVTADFLTLAERPDILIKIQARLRALFGRDLILDWDDGRLKIFMASLATGSTAYSSGSEASGLLHLIALLTTLYDDDVGGLLIDEPEVSLHPQLQAFLLGEMLGVAGYPDEKTNKKLIVIATHSTEFLRLSVPEDLTSLVFCYDLKSNPVQIPASAGELRNRRIASLIAQLGQDHKLAMFAKRPLVVEGPSDSIICSALSRRLDLHLEAAGSQILPVVGKGQIGVIVKLLRLLGKTPVVLADADAIADGLDSISGFVQGHEADKAASKLGFSSTQAMAQSIYEDFASNVAAHWNDIAAEAEKQAYWKSRGEDLELAKRRSAFTTLFTLESRKLAELPNWLSIRQRLESLLTLLEEQGFFVLRLGTIEAYFKKASKVAQKVSAAVEEAEHIVSTSEATVLRDYADIVRCVSHAASKERIDEVAAVAELVLAVAGPVLGRMASGTLNQDPNVIARTIIGDRSRMFSLETKTKDKVAGKPDPKVALEVSLGSKILDTSHFPITLEIADNLVSAVQAKLGLSATAKGTEDGSSAGTGST